MKILLYGINFAPELTGIGKYTGEMAAFEVGGMDCRASLAMTEFSLPVLLRQVFWRAQVVWVVEPALFCAPEDLKLRLLAAISGHEAP